MSARFVVRACIGLLVLQTLTRGWTCLRGYFYIDDFSFTGRSMQFPLFDGTYLTHPYNSHVMPGAYAWVWLTTHAFPLAWVPVALAILVLQATVGVVLIRLLLELFGPRPLVVPLVAIGLLSPVTLPASLWWSAALNQLPQQLAIVCALYGHVRYLRTGRARAAVTGPLALVCGLCFSEKSVLLVPLVLAITVAYFASGSILGRLRQVFVRDCRIWAGYAMVALPYAAYYLLRVPSPLRTTPIPGHDLADLVVTSVFRATIPGLLGGPLTWLPVGFAGALSDPSGFAVVVFAILAGVLVTATLLLQRRSGWAWLILVVYVGVNLTILSRSRATVIGPIIGTEYRYQTDIAVVAAVLGGFAAMPVAGSWVRGIPDRIRPRAEVGDALEIRLIRPLREVGLLPAGPPSTVVAILLTVVISACALWSAKAYDPWWVHNPARPWISAVRAEIDQLPPGTVLADTPVPQDVAWALIGPYNFSYRVLSPVLATDKRLMPGRSASRIVVPDDEGRLRLAAVSGSTAPKGSSPGCGWRLGAVEQRIPLPGGADLTDPVVRLGALASGPARLTVRAGGQTVNVPVVTGLQAAFFQFKGRIDAITVLRANGSATVCTDDVTAGYPVAIPGSTP